MDNVLPAARKLRPPIEPVDLLNEQPRGKKSPPFKFQHVELTRFTRFTPDGVPDASALKREQCEVILRNSPYSKLLFERKKSKRKLDTQKRAKDNAQRMLESMLNTFPLDQTQPVSSSSSSNIPREQQQQQQQRSTLPKRQGSNARKRPQPYPKVGYNTTPSSTTVASTNHKTTKLPSKLRNELLASYHHPITELLAWDPCDSSVSITRTPIPDEQVAAMYSSTSAKMILQHAARTNIEIPEATIENEERQEYSIKKEQREMDDLSLCSAQQEDPVRLKKGIIEQSTFEEKVKEGQQLLCKHQQQLLCKHQQQQQQQNQQQQQQQHQQQQQQQQQQQNDKDKTNKDEANFSTCTSSTISVEDASVPKLIDTVTSHGNAPPIYQIVRQAAPMRKPPAVQKLRDFFSRHPELKTGPAEYLMLDTNSTNINVTPSTMDMTRKAMHVRSDKAKDDLMVLDSSDVKRQLSYMLHQIPIKDKPLPISNEMQTNLNALLLADVGKGLWEDRVSSTIARPLSASNYCSNPALSAVTGGDTGISVAFNSVAERAATLQNNTVVQQEQFVDIRLVPDDHGVRISIPTESLQNVLNAQTNEMKEDTDALLAQVVSFPYVQEAHEAATLLARVYKKRTHRRDLHVLLIQRLVRGHIARMRLERDRIERVYSAMLVQALARSKQTRRRIDYMQYVAHQQAAMTIQKVIRGRRSRVSFAALKQALNLRAAIKIQSVYRGHCGRNTYYLLNQLRLANRARMVQAIGRMLYTRAKYRIRRAEARLATTRIQSLIRGVQVRACIIKWNIAANNLQRVLLRGVKGRFEYAQLNRPRVAARRIQSLWRALVTRQAADVRRSARLKLANERQKREDAEAELAAQAARDTLPGYLKTEVGREEMRKNLKIVKAERVEHNMRRKRMTAEERKEDDALSAFQMFDMDNSGFIDRGELKAIAAELCAPMSDIKLDAAMKEMDRDESGLISREEFKVWFLGGENTRKGNGIATRVMRLKLQGTRMLRDLTGSTTNARARRIIEFRLVSKAEQQKINRFRIREPVDIWYLAYQAKIRGKRLQVEIP